MVFVACASNGGDGRGYLGGEAGITVPPAERVRPAFDCATLPTPDYRTAVAPLIAEKCLGCHSPGGEGTGDLSSLSGLCKEYGIALTRVQDCTMPSAPLQHLTDQEYETLSCWPRTECPKPKHTP